MTNNQTVQDLNIADVLLGNDSRMIKNYLENWMENCWGRTINEMLTVDKSQLIDLRARLVAIKDLRQAIESDINSGLLAEMSMKQGF